MADSKRHWKESIGVMPGMTPKKIPAAGPSGPSTTTASGVVLPTVTPPSRAVGQREAFTIAHTEDSILTPIENLIDSLPSGSITFADHVQQKLWQRPTPVEIRALGVIAAEKALAPPATRKQAVRVVAVRQRIGRLLFSPLSTIDGERIAAIGSEWVRLANLIREMRRHWPTAAPDSADERVLRAAFDLLIDPFDLEVHATLYAEISRLVDAIRNGSAAGTPVWNAPVTEVDELVGSISQGVLAADQGLCLELFAGCTLAQRHANEQERAALERDRRLLELLAEQLEIRVDVMLQAHGRDMASARRLAAWRRYLTETRSRVNEALTRPAAPAAPAPQHSAASEVHITAPQGGTDPERETTGHLTTPIPAPISTSALAALPVPPRQAAQEESIVEHLRSVRSSVLSTPEETAPTPSWKRWIPLMVGVVAIAALGLYTARLPAPLPVTAPVALDNFESALPLIQATRAGSLLVVTADPEWASLSGADRQRGATRLMTLAEEIGCFAGIVVDADGTPLAVWSPGREPSLRRPANRHSALSRLVIPDRESSSAATDFQPAAR